MSTLMDVFLPRLKTTMIKCIITCLYGLPCQNHDQFKSSCSDFSNLLPSLNGETIFSPIITAQKI